MAADLRYQELRFWSPMLGLDAARISAADAHGAEHFAVVPMVGPGSHNRWVRERAHEAIEAHVRLNRQAGEVKVNLEREGRVA